jgi:hypothetical protein
MSKNLIITEEEKNEILKLHKSYIFESLGDEVLGEQDAPVDGSTSQAPTQQPTQTQQLTKIQQLQTKLNEKFNSGLTVDGKWGPKTASAVVKALKSTTTQQPVQTQQPTPQEPIQKLATLPAGTVQRTNQSTQLSNQAQIQPNPDEVVTRRELRQRRRNR